MSVTIANDRVVSVGDEVTLLGQRWFIGSHTFKQLDRMTVVANDDESEYFMNIDAEGNITVEIQALKVHPMDFA